MRCPECRAKVSSAQSACARCGAPLEPPQAVADTDGPPAERRRRLPSKGSVLWTAILVGALALGIGLGQVFLSYRSSARHAAAAQASKGPARGGPASPSGNAQTQAQGVDALLASGKQAHERLQYNAETCDGLAAAVPRFQQIVRDRRQELSDARKLPLDRLSHAADLQQALTDSYQYSLAADRAYLAWAQAAEAQDCGDAAPPATSDLADAQAADDKAAPAKRRFLRLWNPIAVSQGLPTYGWRDL